MKLTLLSLLALSAFAQDLPINGTVSEFGTNARIAAAEVILSEFVTIDGLYTRKPVATVLTDSRGAFTLRPEHPGNYYVQANKPTYLTGDEQDSLGPILGSALADTPLTVANDPVPDIHFILIRPGGLTGTVVDEDGKPVPNFTVTTTLSGVPESLSGRAVTDANGVFTFARLLPVPRLIRAGNDLFGPAAVIREFTKEDIEKVDEDVETTYWPGGVLDPTLAVPIDMIPGNVVNAGTIRLRKAPYYRAHVTIAGECRSVGGAVVDIRFYAGAVSGCRGELLFRRLSPGSHKLILWTDGLEKGDVAEWAVAQFNIARENVEVPVVFYPSIEVPGRIVNASGGLALATGDAAVRLLPEDAFGARALSIKPNPQGDFTIPNVVGPRQRVRFEPVPPELAVKEIRYNNQLTPDGFITVAPGALLEIVMDDQPASIGGTAGPDARVYVSRWPSAGVISPPYAFITSTNSAGAFLVGSLAAGEYRAVAVPSDSPYIEPARLSLLLSAALKITLNRGVQQTIELKVEVVPR